MTTSWSCQSASEIDSSCLGRNSAVGRTPGVADRHNRTLPTLCSVNWELVVGGLGLVLAGAFGDERVRPVYPVSAGAAVADLTLPKLRYVCNPTMPAMQGTEKVT